MNLFGLALLIWLAVGFITGVKIIFVDEAFSNEKFKEAMKKFEEEHSNDETAMIALNIVRKKSNVIAVFTLLGFIGAILDVVATFKKIKKFFLSKIKKER